MVKLRLAPGRTIGRYRIVEPLDASGIEGLYSATDLRLDRPVAVRVLSDAETPEPAACRRYLRNPRLLATFRHPNIVPLYDLQRRESIHLLVMAPVAGRSLAAAIPVGGMQAPSALKAALQIAGALDHAHHAAVAHGRLSLATILLDEEWSIRILDFGLAGAAAEPPADIAAFGDIFFEMLSGRRPGPGGEPLPAGVPRALAKLVANCRGPAAEPLPSAAALKAELEAALRNG